MDLQIIRQYLDTLDKALRYILTQRMSIIPLVAESKFEKGLPLYQPGSEEQMYTSMREYAGEVGLNPELIVDIYRNIIKEALRIEHEVDSELKQEKQRPELKLNEELVTVLNENNKLLKEFIKNMESVKLGLQNQGVKGDEVTNFLTGYYKNEILKVE